MLERLRALVPRRPEPEPAGLAWSALYPTLTPELRLRTYVPVRFAPASITPAVLVAANPARRALSILNDTTAQLLIAESNVVGGETFTVRLDPGQTYVAEGPDIYRGDVAGVWTFASAGGARITETT